MNDKNNFFKKIEEARNSREYEIYLQVVDNIFDMVDEMYNRVALPSDYWDEQSGIFEYIFDASPLIIESLRYHCRHLTGVSPYEYGEHHVRDKKTLQERYNLLKQHDPIGLFVPESQKLGGFGFKDNGLIYNVDTLKYYESILTLYKSNYLQPFIDSDDRLTVLEIGGGWGGLSYQFNTLFPNTTYVIIDLPQVLLFSATYLRVHFPEANCLMYNGPKDANIDEKYDFIFLPHYCLPELSGRIDLAVNTVSFQEMSSDQVENYCKKLHELECPRLYSYNKDQNLNNMNLGVLSKIIGKYFRLKLFEADFLQHMRSIKKKEVGLALIKKFFRENIITKNAYDLLRIIKNKNIINKNSFIDTRYKHYLGTHKDI